MKKQVLFAIILSLVLTASTAAQGLATQKVLTLQAAKDLAAVADKFAQSKGWTVNIAIVDASGDLLYFQRRLGVQAGSIEVAILKASSAAKFKRPTKVFSDVAKEAPGITMVPGAIGAEGGLPLEWDGHFLGGIGISGVTSAQDGVIAKAAVDQLGKIVE